MKRFTIPKDKTYAEKQDYLRELAIDFQSNFNDLWFSDFELAVIRNYFYVNAKRYGLLKEFRENGII